MQAAGPHYYLFADSVGRSCKDRQWRFVLQPSGDGERIVAFDVEHDADGMRLNLLAVVRGLEALDGPSHVTLWVANRFVRRGILYDLCQWRESEWRWERFGKLVPIRDLDLWKRVDRALDIHEVECVAWHAAEHAIWAGCSVGGRLPEYFSHTNQGGAAADGGGTRRRDAGRTYPLRRQGVAARRRLTDWRQSVLDQLAGWGQTALSQTA
jgi:ribonuclease HI